ncbi:MAG: response regulator transcription factor [Dehalococcoidia bacterium]|nr:response regulator transcription factor [Dehalococcoidia bacterium]
MVGEAADGAEAIEWIKNNFADVVLMDIRMPGVGGIEATAKIVHLRPDAKVLILTVIGDPYTLAQSILLGASGCYIYGQSPDELISNIRSLALGHTIPLPPSVKPILQKMVDNLKSYRTECAEVTNDALTARQYEVLNLLTEGMSNKQIAQVLNLEVSTVKNHLKNIYLRLGVQNRYEAIRFILDKK